MMLDKPKRKARMGPPPLGSKQSMATATAVCYTEGCGWMATGPNALAVASLHARADGHGVEASRTVTILYNLSGVVK